MVNKNPYTWAGISLLTAGAFISLTAYFLLSLNWLTALGMCMLVLSFILLALGKTIPKLPPEVCRLLLETGINNIGSVIEELGINNKAVYLPSSFNSGRPQALIPLHNKTHSSPPNKNLPHRLIARYGAAQDDVGLLLTTLGSAAIGLLPSRPSRSPAEIESALTSLLTGTLGMADGTSLAQNGSHISVEIRNPRIENRATWSHQCLGGPLASIVATIVAEAWDKPVIIQKEDYQKRKCLIELEVMGENIQ